MNKSASEIRQIFMDYFQEKNHKIVPSAPIVIKNDPTLMFTNAGMNQFKDYFLGNKVSEFPRIADTQKCLRVSGKHNDLEEVGVDTYHHTMFEMLGNWSFGDYFKEETITWAWDLLTVHYQIPKDRLYVTIFEGDAKELLEKDIESYNLWKNLIDEHRIINGNKKDNFWEMGDTGPCGPCTEIHVDCRPDAERAAVDGKELVNNDHPQVIEIWNNVFIQFNRKMDGSLEELPSKHVDTGMGFERLVRVLQGKSSNYDTDIFLPTITLIEQLSNKKYHYKDDKSDIAFRVISDHIRAIAFTITDGQIPSNNGAGYVIKFKPAPSLFEHEPVLSEHVHELVIEMARPATTRSGTDSRISVTIAGICQDFFVNRERILLYVCETADFKHLARVRKFDGWFRQFNDHQYLKLDAQFPDPVGMTYYISLILRWGHPNIHTVIDAFEALTDQYNEGK